MSSADITKRLVYLAANGDYGESPYTGKDLDRLVNHPDIHSVFIDLSTNQISLKAIIDQLAELLMQRLAVESTDMQSMEKRALLEALEQVDYVQAEAGRLLGLSQRQINYKIEKFGITHPRWRKHKGAQR